MLRQKRPPGRIYNRISIDESPAMVANKSRIDDREGHQGKVATHLERKKILGFELINHQTRQASVSRHRKRTDPLSKPDPHYYLYAWTKVLWTPKYSSNHLGQYLLCLFFLGTAFKRKYRWAHL